MWLLEIGTAAFTLTRDDVLNLVGWVTPVGYQIRNAVTRASVAVGKGASLTPDAVDVLGAS